MGAKAVQREYVKLKREQLDALAAEARYRVASNVVANISQRLGQPLSLVRTNFERHYGARLALPFEVLANLDATNIARFEEQCDGALGVNLEVQSTRLYPHGTLAAHLLGHLQDDTDSHTRRRVLSSPTGRPTSAARWASRRRMTPTCAAWRAPSPSR